MIKKDFETSKVKFINLLIEKQMLEKMIKTSNHILNNVVGLRVEDIDDVGIFISFVQSKLPSIADERLHRILENILKYSVAFDQLESFGESALN